MSVHRFEWLGLLCVLAFANASRAGQGDVVYLGNSPLSGRQELFHVAAGSGVVTRLNAQLVAGGDVIDFVVGPRGRQVVYRADQDADDVFELYHVSLSKKSLADVQPTKLNATLVAGGDVLAFEFDAKGRRLVYLADQDIDQTNEVYLVDLGKQSLEDVQPTKLNTPLAASGDVLDYALDAKGMRFVYRADQDTDGVFELYFVDLGKQSLADVQPIKLNASFLPTSDVAGFLFCPKGRMLVYRADQETDEAFELYGVGLDEQSLANPQPVKLSGALVADGSVEAFRLDARARQLVYLADQDTDELFEFFHVRLDGKGEAGPPTKLNGEFASGVDLVAFDLGPKGRELVYLADQDTPLVFELYHVALDAPADAGFPLTKLNAPLVAGGDVSTFAIDPTGRHLVFQADQDTNDTSELYRVGLDSKSLADVQPTKLNTALAGGGDTFNYAFGPRGRELVYQADQDVNDVLELFHVSLSKQSLADVQPTKLNDALTSGGDVANFDFGRNGRRLTYRADQDTDGRFEVFEVRLAKQGLASEQAVKLNAEVSGLGVIDFAYAGS